MTTKGEQSGGPDIDGSNAIPSVNPSRQTPSGSSAQEVKRPNGKGDWTQFILYAIASFAAIGLAITLVGVFLFKNDTVIVVGTLMVTASATAWIVGGIYVLIGLIRQRFKSGPGGPP